METWKIIAIAVSAGLVALILLITLIQYCTSSYSLKGKVVVITGGSSGIGKSIAKKCLSKGAHVALIARTEKTLLDAKAELEKLGFGGVVTVHMGDVSDDAAAQRAMQAAAAAHGGKIDVVVTSAGVSKPCRFEDMSSSEFTSVLLTNVTGTRNAIFHALPAMSGVNGRGGRIVLISSQAGQVGLYGYTAYSASKFALNGFSQALAMELHTRNIKVSICFPPDTDTPLLAEENKTKPTVTKLLSEATQVVSPDAVASSCVSGIEHYSPLIGVGFDGWMLATLTSGMTPQPSFLMLCIEFVSLGLWRIIGLFYVTYFFFVIGRNDGGTSGGKGKTSSMAAATTTTTTNNVARSVQQKNNNNNDAERKNN